MSSDVSQCALWCSEPVLDDAKSLKVLSYLRSYKPEVLEFCSRADSGGFIVFLVLSCFRNKHLSCYSSDSH